MYDMQRYATYPQQYNPYQMPQQMQIQQPSFTVQPQNGGLFGRTVNNINEVTANDVPMNAPFAIFPKSDGSEIYIKSWGANGLIQTITYKPYTEPKEDTQQENTMETLLEPIIERLDRIESKINQPPKQARTKKETDAE